jgi:hypothetical protein
MIGSPNAYFKLLITISPLGPQVTLELKRTKPVSPPPLAVKLTHFKKKKKEKRKKERTLASLKSIKSLTIKVHEFGPFQILLKS